MSKNEYKKNKKKMYLDYLNENIDKYKLILHADTRYVIFQQDLFNLYDSKKSFLGVALEEGFLSEKVNKNGLFMPLVKRHLKKLKIKEYYAQEQYGEQQINFFNY